VTETIIPKPRRGFGTISRLPNGKYESRYRLHRKAHKRWHNTLRQAEKYLNAIETKLDEGTYTVPVRRRVTFNQLVALLEDDYRVQERRSLPRLKTAIAHLTAAFDGLPVLAIDVSRIRHYEQERLSTGASRASVNKELSALRRAFHLAEEGGLVARTPPIHTPEPNNRRMGFLDADDFASLLKALPEELKGPVEFAFRTGWRMRSEVLPLTWDRVDFTAQTVRLDTSKSDEPRLFPFGMLPALVTLLKIQRERTTTLERRTGMICRTVFHRNGKPIRSFEAAWETACDAAAHEERNGLRTVVRPALIGLIPHDLRRSAARNLRRAGVDEGTIMKLCGWKTRSMFDRYNIIDERDLNAGVAKLAAATG
jgi:integrase